VTLSRPSHDPLTALSPTPTSSVASDSLSGWFLSGPGFNLQRKNHLGTHRPLLQALSRAPPRLAFLSYELRIIRIRTRGTEAKLPAPEPPFFLPYTRNPSAQFTHFLLPCPFFLIPSSFDLRCRIHSTVLARSSSSGEAFFTVVLPRTRSSAFVASTPSHHPTTSPFPSDRIIRNPLEFAASVSQQLDKTCCHSFRNSSSRH